MESSLLFEDPPPSDTSRNGAKWRRRLEPLLAHIDEWAVVSQGPQRQQYWYQGYLQRVANRGKDPWSGESWSFVVRRVRDRPGEAKLYARFDGYSKGDKR